MTNVRTAPHRLLAVLIATAMALLVLPVTAALAAPTGSVARTSPSDVFPAASRNFSFTVTNGGSAVVGEAINWVRFVLPSDEAGVVHNTAAITPPAGWTASREGVLEDGSPDREAIQTVTFRASSATAALRAGASLPFTFPAQIDRPLSTDRTGAFTVAASSDSGRTTKGLTGTPTALDVNVKVLEVLNLGATAPVGVATDQSGTAGQTGVKYAYDVKNYARNTVTVSGALTSNGNDKTGDPVTGVPVPGVGSNAFGEGLEKTAPVTHTIELGTVTPPNNRTATFSAQATATDAASAIVGRPFTVEVPAALTLSNLQPKRVRTATGSPAVVFTADASKTGSPTLTVSSGTMTITTGTISVPVKLAKTPISFGAGAVNTTVEFEPVNLSDKLGSLVGVEVPATATATVVSEDGNGFDAIKSTPVLTDTLTLDNLAPGVTVKVTLPLDEDGRRQTAARDTNRIQVDGTITGIDGAPAVTGTGPRRLVVKANDGTKDYEIPVTVSGSGSEYTFTGSLAISYTPGATLATVTATVPDTAGNPGSAPAASYVIDNVIPKLEGPGRTTTTKSILIRYSDENSDLLGGCDPQHYLINNVPGLVERVEFAGNNPTGGNGTQCGEATAAPGNSGTRILILRNEMAEDATPQVTYSAASRSLGADPVKDGAANEVVRTTIDTIRQIAPLAPEIVRVTRAQGAETATKVDADNAPSTYYTRFNKVTGGTADDLEVRFLGSRNNYTVQVLEVGADGKPVLGADGKEKAPLTTKTVTGPATPIDANEQGIRIPLGEAEGLYRRALRFVTSSGTGANATTVLGELALFNVELDRTAPTLNTPTVSGTTVTVGFGEVIQSGGEFASDWFGLATTSGGTRAYQAESVKSVNNTKELTVPLPSGSTFAGVDYRFTSGPDGGNPVVDRAGNRLPNQRKLVPAPTA